ncbi:MAG: ATP-binding cassette domain-containing protein [Actinomycetota bacterium]|nr:ATP-binding cassette domain-containing protein [Actinomycetota bacterium]
MARVRFVSATKRYGDIVALESLNLTVEDGELVVFVGPSGSGKTTALRLLAGLESISSGHVYIGDRQVDDIPPRERDIAMVFQDYALYPQMTVYKNLAFGLRMRKVPGHEIDKQVRDAAGILGLENMLERRPRQLSGGQRQRVALGRALVRSPQVFLMDEPLSNLDAKLRVQTRVEIARIQREFGTTTVYVTHDQTEAMTLGQRVAVMKDGALQQFDTPKTLYDRPANLFVAGFIGSPAMNLTEASLEREEGALVIRFGEHRLPIGDDTLARRPELNRFEGRKLVIGIRPEGFEDASLATGAPPGKRLSVVVDLREDVGSDVYAYFSGIPPWQPRTSEGSYDAAEAARPTDAATFIARLSPQTRIREGARVDLLVDEEAMHFFNPDTGFGVDGGRGR